MRILDVYLENELVGTITENRKGGRFSYRPEIADSYAGSPVLSLSLPAKQKPFSETKTMHWFNGLLPEGPRRDEICKDFGVGTYDWIGLLSEIGWECAGAVRIFPHGGERNYPASYYEFSKADLVRALSDASLRFPNDGHVVFRMSLGGFQDKMCVCMPKLVSDETYVDANDVLVPCGEAASTHILKPENTRVYPGVAESEAWAMRAAGNAARCSRVALLDLPQAPSTLVVERYDRIGGQWPLNAERIHQEDACQALGLDPSEKYANPRMAKGSDPTYKAIADLLITYAEDPASELAELLRQITVNLALGNRDAHAKNISFLYKKPGLPTVSPLYDVVPIAEIELRTHYLSLRINGCIVPKEVEGKDVLDEAVSWGLSEKEAVSIMLECLEKLAAGVKTAGIAYPEAAKRHEANAIARIAHLENSISRK